MWRLMVAVSINMVFIDIFAACLCPCMGGCLLLDMATGGKPVLLCVSPSEALLLVNSEALVSKVLMAILMIFNLGVKLSGRLAGRTDWRKWTVNLSWVCSCAPTSYSWHQPSQWQRGMPSGWRRMSVPEAVLSMCMTNRHEWGSLKCCVTSLWQSGKRWWLYSHQWLACVPPCLCVCVFLSDCCVSFNCPGSVYSEYAMEAFAMSVMATIQWALCGICWYNMKAGWWQWHSKLCNVSNIPNMVSKRENSETEELGIRLPAETPSQAKQISMWKLPWYSK